jgi:hypothetical protein
MNNVEHIALSRQSDTPDCVNADFRSCGNITADVAAVTSKLQRMMQLMSV